MISRIFDRLYVGDSNFTKADLDELSIDYVINVGGKVTGLEDYHYHLSDDGSNPIWALSTVLKHLGDRLMYTNDRVLVCCRGGVSRSVYVILLWLRRVGMSREEAYKFIKERHPAAQINLDLLRSW
ncbi:MAG: dual specificity protein phosphatase family protein [Deltaproteobacteria bacterium]|nr:dual specificity protein phosphatase family protein [Deltaproteobacteria bacterium]